MWTSENDEWTVNRDTPFEMAYVVNLDRMGRVERTLSQQDLERMLAALKEANA